MNSPRVSGSSRIDMKFAEPKVLNILDYIIDILYVNLPFHPWHLLILGVGPLFGYLHYRWSELLS